LARGDRRPVWRLLTASGEVLWWELNVEAILRIRAQRIPHIVRSRGGSPGDAIEVAKDLLGTDCRNVVVAK
jgi:DNA polymerase V